MNKFNIGDIVSLKMKMIHMEYLGLSIISIKA
jgi:hypothetical protein